MQYTHLNPFHLLRYQIETKYKYLVANYHTIFFNHKKMPFTAHIKSKLNTFALNKKQKETKSTIKDTKCRITSHSKKCREQGTTIYT